MGSRNLRKVSLLVSVVWQFCQEFRLPSRADSGMQGLFSPLARFKGTAEDLAPTAFVAMEINRRREMCHSLADNMGPGSCNLLNLLGFWIYVAYEVYA